MRAVLDITFAPDTFFHSDHYTGDERVELTGTKGFVRCNRISACGIQEPSLVVYCPPCAAREFGYRPDLAASYVCAWEPSRARADV